MRALEKQGERFLKAFVLLHNIFTPRPIFGQIRILEIVSLFVVWVTSQHQKLRIIHNFWKKANDGYRHRKGSRSYIIVCDDTSYIWYSYMTFKCSAVLSIHENPLQELYIYIYLQHNMWMFRWYTWIIHIIPCRMQDVDFIWRHDLIYLFLPVNRNFRKDLMY